MKINPSEPYIKYVDILNHCNEETMQAFRKDAERVYGSPWALRIKDFFALSEGDLTYIGITSKEQTIFASVRQYVWITEFREMAEQITNMLKTFTIPQSAESQRAAVKCIKMGFKEATLIFIRSYFGLKSFGEAENISVADFIVAQKDEYNTAIFKHTMAEIQHAKIKKK